MGEKETKHPKQWENGNLLLLWLLLFFESSRKKPFFSCHQKVPDFRFSSYQFESRECQSDKQKNDNISTNLYLAFCCCCCRCCCCWWVWVCLCVCKSNWIGMNECMDTAFFHIRPTQHAFLFPQSVLCFAWSTVSRIFSPHTNYVTRDFSCFVSHPIVFIFHCHAFFLVQFSHHQRRNSFQIAAFIFFIIRRKTFFDLFIREKNEPLSIQLMSYRHCIHLMGWSLTVVECVQVECKQIMYHK